MFLPTTLRLCEKWDGWYLTRSTTWGTQVRWESMLPHTHACIQPPLVVNNHVCASCVFVARLCNLLCEVFVVVTHWVKNVHMLYIKCWAFIGHHHWSPSSTNYRSFQPIIANSMERTYRGKVMPDCKLLCNWRMSCRFHPALDKLQYFLSKSKLVHVGLPSITVALCLIMFCSPKH